MTTKLYRVEVPMRLMVEANTRAEAIRDLRALWREVSEHLPVGAGVFADDSEMDAHLRSHLELR